MTTNSESSDVDPASDAQPMVNIRIDKTAPAMVGVAAIPAGSLCPSANCTVELPVALDRETACRRVGVTFVPTTGVTIAQISRPLVKAKSSCWENLVFVKITFVYCLPSELL
jgi:hypothetical protein